MIATITSAGIEAPISYWQFAAFTVLVFWCGVGAGVALISRHKNRRSIGRISVLHKI